VLAQVVAQLVAARLVARAPPGLERQAQPPGGPGLLDLLPFVPGRSASHKPVTPPRAPREFLHS
jgi:hypothetical protein